nr:hypothetical protein [Tanacetum cinerariifolium]
MVNTRTDADLSAAVQNALQTLLPQIRAEIREEFRTSSGPSDAGRNPPPVTIHTWLERFNKQKPHSFEKATAPVDADNWISHMEKIFDVMGCEDAFKTRLAVYKFEGNAFAWWKAYKQAKGGDAWLITTNTETSTEFMQHFLRLAGFLGAAAGTEEEQAKNFQWGLRRSTLNHLMCMSYMDVAQVSNAARNYKILRKRDDDDTERPDKRQKSGTLSTEQPSLKDKFIWSDQEKNIQKIDRLARSLLIQGLLNDIYSLIDSNKTAKDIWDALARHMLGFEYGEQDRKAAVLYECETFKAAEGELLLDTYIRYLQVINYLKKCGYSKDNCKLNFKFLNNLQPEWK